MPKITELPVAVSLTGSEPVPIVQSGITKETTTGQVAALATSNGAAAVDFSNVGSATFSDSFSLLRLGGATNAFAAIKRNGNQIDIRFADDSDFAGVQATYYRLKNGSYIQDFASGVIRLTDNPGTSFDRLQFGGGGASFPALKLNGSGLDVRLADDSDYGKLTAGTFGVNGNAVISAPTDGVLRLQNGAMTGFTMLRFGGDNASFPGIKSSGTTLSARLADDSADAPFTALYVKAKATTVAGLPSASTAGAGAFAFVTDATDPAFGSPITGGGSVAIPVFSDGAHWLPAAMGVAAAKADLSNVDAHALPAAPDDAAAATDGVAEGGVYLNGSTLQVRRS